MPSLSLCGSCDVGSLCPGERDFCHELAKVLTECQYILELAHLICFKAETSKVPNMSQSKICVTDAVGEVCKTANQYQHGLKHFWDGYSYFQPCEDQGKGKCSKVCYTF